MERLSKASPVVKLTAQQKKQMAELESRCAAKIAEKEIALKGEIEKATNEGNFEEAQKAQQQLVNDRKRFQAELEEKKEKVRQGK
ncbi:MAG: hypothetical protein JWM68_3512 [Verrucomicrobiales bacterium]|nr:hypothetical protein [Verrucomicrobiales bacterium]